VDKMQVSEHTQPYLEIDLGLSCGPEA
jgi:hypothetical protein